MSFDDDYVNAVDDAYRGNFPEVRINNALKLSGISKFQREIDGQGKSLVVLEVASSMTKVFNGLTKFYIEGVVHRLVEMKKTKSSVKVQVRLENVGSPVVPSPKGARIE